MIQDRCTDEAASVANASSRLVLAKGQSAREEGRGHRHKGRDVTKRFDAPFYLQGEQALSF